MNPGPESRSRRYQCDRWLERSSKALGRPREPDAHARLRRRSDRRESAWGLQCAAGGDRCASRHEDCLI